MNTNLFPPYFWQRIFVSTIYFQQTVTPSIIHLMQIGVFFFDKTDRKFPTIDFLYIWKSRKRFIFTNDWWNANSLTDQKRYIKSSLYFITQYTQVLLYRLYNLYIDQISLFTTINLHLYKRNQPILCRVLEQARRQWICWIQDWEREREKVKEWEVSQKKEVSKTSPRRVGNSRVTWPRASQQGREG